MRTFYRNPTAGVAVIILQADHLLLVLRKCGRWCIPCGHVDWHESIEQAALRELKEETGLDCELGQVFAVRSNFHNPDQHTVGTWYLGKNVTGKIQAGDDAREAQFWPIQDLPPLAFPTDVSVINELRQHLSRDKSKSNPMGH